MTDQRLTICFPFAGNIIGGSHISALGLIRRLDTDRYRPVVVLEFETGPVAELFSEFEQMIDPGRGSQPVIPGQPFGPAKFARTLLGLPARIRFLRARGIDVVHSNDGCTHASWSLAAHLAGVPFLWHHRGDPTARGLKFAAPVLADRVLTVSRFALPSPGWWSAVKRAEVVHSPFNTSISVDRSAARAALLDELDASDDTLLLGFFGSFISRKRPLDFVNAVTLLRQRLDRPVLGLLFGEALEPALWQALQTRLRDEDASECIRLMGFRSPGAYWIAGCDQLIVPAVREPFGRTLIEAMLVGTPVVATACGGNIEALDGGLGVLVPPGDADALAKAAARVASDPGRTAAMVARAMQTARTRFGEEHHAARVTQIYEELTTRAA